MKNLTIYALGYAIAVALLYLAILVFATPAKAQFQPLEPEVKDTLFYSSEMYIQEHVGNDALVEYFSRSHLANSDGVDAVSWRGYHGSRFTFSGDGDVPPFGADQAYDPSCTVRYERGSEPWNFDAFHYTNDQSILCYGVASMYQVLLDGSDVGDIYLSMAVNTPYDIPQAPLREGAWLHLVENAYIVLNADTLYLKDGFYRSFPSVSNGRCDNARPEYEDPYTGIQGSHGGVGGLVCWPNTDIKFEVDEILEFKMVSKLYWPAPMPIDDSIIVKQQYDAGKPVAGSVQISWRTTVSLGTYLEQRRLEKDWYMSYEYKVLRDGKKIWRGIRAGETEDDCRAGESCYDAIELVPVYGTPRQFQRRKFLVTGLDPNGAYSFCVRGISPGGVGEQGCTLDIIKPVATKRERPTTLALHQNYPNPFNPSTAIEYDIANTQHVRLEAFDTLGRSVAVLVDGYAPPGKHTVRFDASGLPSGLYVYRLSVGSQTLTRTMLLTR